MATDFRLHYIHSLPIEDSDLVLALAILADNEVFALVRDGSLEPAMGGIVLEQVDLE